MRRRLLELCLLAYPRALRGRDRDYLRDLALELADRQGTARQASSLLRGGLRERLRQPRRWPRRVAATSLGIAALALGMSALAGLAAADHDVDRFACHAGRAAGGCAEGQRLLAAREQAGWDCTAVGRPPRLRSSSDWECTRAR